MPASANRSVAKRASKSAAPRQRRSQEELKDRILEAAGMEFRRAGYANATTAAIARRAKVTETQIFRYFGSKENLFHEAVFKPLDQQMLRFFEHFVRDHETMDRRRDAALYIADLQHFLSENADMLGSLLTAQRYDAGVAREVGEIESLNRYFERGAARMRAGVKGKSRVDPKLMVRTSFAAVLGCVLFKDWLFPRGLASEKDIQAAINDFVLEGLAASMPDLNK
jgi:AcrR family transcriptional regulator